MIERGHRPIGIDLGTTNSCVATIGADGRPEIVVNRQGERTLPSVVSFAGGPGARPQVGAPAKRLAITQPATTIFAAKRLIGRRWDDPEVQRLVAALPYRVAPAPNGDAWVRIEDQLVAPEVVSGHVLDALRQIAEAHLEAHEPLEAVITVPAYFDHAQRQATKDAAEIAGLRVLRLLNEPTAAALGYGAHREPASRFAVCDLGGGTFDVSLVNVEDGVFEVISTDGDILLGGEDFDRRLVAELAGEIRQAHGLDVDSDPTALQRLRDEAETAKHVLSEAQETTLQIPYLGVVGGNPVNYARTLRREELERWTAELLRRLEPPCHAALANAGLAPGDVDQVLLVGGMTRMPAVQRTIADVFRRRPAKNANPDEAVAIGAATQCAILEGRIDGVVLLDVTSRTLGIHAGGGRFAPVIPRNATVPTREERIVPTTQAGQREIFLEVFEGEHAEVARNRHLATFVVGGLPEAAAGEVLVLVEFTVDVDGILRVGARDLLTGSRPELRRTSTCGLTRAELRRIAVR